MRPGDLIDDRALKSVEEDRFRATDVVAELAELARTAKTPCDIVLFGAWGSGKSSVKELLATELRAEDERNRGIHFATVDASKFAEVPLRRHFISQVVESLGLEHEKYDKKLYEKKTSFALELGKRDVLRFLEFLGLFVALA